MSPPLQTFDFSVLESPKFKEDSVREEIIAPLLWALGYSASGPSRIERSTALEHPYVSIGSIRKKVSIFPDYLLFAGDRPKWILDAKAPTESIDDPEHLSQAYTYAIHRDVRVNRYAVCNGREFALYFVSDMDSRPRLRVRLDSLANSWGDLQQALRPFFLEDEDREYAKDFGLLLQKVGFSTETDLVFVGLPVMHLGFRSGDADHSLMINIRAEEREYAACFDFGKPQFDQLLRLVPPVLAAHLSKAVETAPALVTIEGGPNVTVTARPGTALQENEKEIYLPLIVRKFS